MSRLSGKICVVTGGARGIGLAISKAFVDEGASVLLTDKDMTAGQKASLEIGCSFTELDVANEHHWNRLAEQAPRIDVLVNNAGITGFEALPIAHDPETATLEAWREVHRVNLDGVFLGCRYAIRAMKASGHGAIINIASRSGLVGIPMAAAYASSKAAVRNHTKTVALYCAQMGWAIRCNVINPAAILTPMWDPLLGNGSDRAAIMANYVADTPLQRFGRPEEVAALAVLLASDAATYMTGAELNLDGGLLAGTTAIPSPRQN